MYMMLISVLCFGMIGVGLRFAADSLISFEAMPLATFSVNVIGCFLAGWIFSSPEISPVMRNSLLIGLCGGLTTFSSFIVQTLSFMKEGEITRAFAYFSLSIVAGFLAAWLGMNVTAT